jgi:hypothetical protein
MNCILHDSLRIDTEDRPDPILFISHDIIIYLQENQIITGSCRGEILSQVAAPVDYFKYEFLEFSDAVLFIFNGDRLILLDKHGHNPLITKLDPVRTGKIVGKLYPGYGENSVIFATKQRDTIQFINYNFISNSKLAQTSSWKVSSLTDMYVTEDHILFAVLDKSRIMCCDMKTGETLWTRFETSPVERGITIHNGNLLYACQNILKQFNGTSLVTYNPPLSVSSIEHVNEWNIYASANEQKHVFSYHVASHEVAWQVYGHKKIVDSFAVKNALNADILVVQNNDGISLINLKTGQVDFNLRVPNLYRIRKSSDHIFLQATTRNTTIIAGKEHE